MWRNISYDMAIKNHIVCAEIDLCELVTEEVFKKYHKTPSSVTDLDVFHLDPGGMICLKNQPKKSDWEHFNVSVRPELILNTIMAWNNAKILDKTLKSGQKIYKVYFAYSVVIMPEQVYHKIGSWLMLGKTDGYIARMELAEALAGNESVQMMPLPTEGEA